MGNGTLGDTIDHLRKVDEIRSCQDCPLCTSAHSTFGGLIVTCNDENGPELTNGHLTRRHPDCPRVGTVATWP